MPLLISLKDIWRSFHSRLSLPRLVSQKLYKIRPRNFSNLWQAYASCELQATAELFVHRFLKAETRLNWSHGAVSCRDCWTLGREFHLRDTAQNHRCSSWNVCVTWSAVTECFDIQLWTSRRHKSRQLYTPAPWRAAFVTYELRPHV